MRVQVHLKLISLIASSSGSTNRSLDEPIKIVTGTSWRTSSHSTYNGNCVGVGHLNDKIVGVKDTKHHGRGPVLAFTQDEWSVFLRGIKAGEYDSI
jgi:hypothetical protein